MKYRGVFAAIALWTVAVVIVGNLALKAQDDAGIGQIAASSYGLDGGLASSSASMLMGILSIGPNPPAAGDWPCVGGAAACSTVPKGGFVIGFPSIINVPHTCASCGQIYFTFDTTTATGSASLEIEVKQGFTTLAKGTGTITVAANQAWIITMSSFTFSSKAAAGDATITASVTNNGTTIKSSAPIVLN